MQNLDQVMTSHYIFIGLEDFSLCCQWNFLYILTEHQNWNETKRQFDHNFTILDFDNAGTDWS